MSHRMGKPTICIGENKGTDQLRSICEADQRLCCRYADSTIPLLSKSKISSLLPSSVTIQLGLCRTWSEPKLLVFSRTDSNDMSRPMGKPTICIGENKGADQLRSNCEADQRLCFRYSDSTFPLLLNPKFQASSSFV